MSMEEKILSAKRVDELFRISVWLKGIHAGLELFSGFLLLAFTPVFFVLPQYLTFLSQKELSEDPKDAVAHFFLNIGQQFSISGELFFAFYLFAHGLVKLIVVVALLRRKAKLYPWCIAVLGAFIAYELYRFSLTQGWWLLALSLFDAVVIYFVWREYQLLAHHKTIQLSEEI